MYNIFFSFYPTLAPGRIPSSKSLFTHQVSESVFINNYHISATWASSHRVKMLTKILPPQSFYFFRQYMHAHAYGVLAVGSAHGRPSARPPIECVCKVTFKHLPLSLRSHIQSFGTLGKFSKSPLFCPFFCFVGILIFLLLRTATNISEPYDNPLGRKAKRSERKRKRKRKKRTISAHAPCSRSSPINMSGILLVHVFA